LEVQRMHVLFPGLQVYSDIGSGCNFERKALREILQLTLLHRISKIHVSEENRLCTIGFELLKWVLESQGAQVCVFGTGQVCQRVNERQCADDVFDLIQQITSPSSVTAMPPTDEQHVDYESPVDCDDAPDALAEDGFSTRVRRRMH
jgi:predicted site-specific integrase-resolvase